MFIANRKIVNYDYRLRNFLIVYFAKCKVQESNTLRLLTAPTSKPGEPYVSGLRYTKPAITANMTMSAAITILSGTSAFVRGRRRVNGPASETG